MSNQPAKDTAQHDVDPRSAPIDGWPTGMGADEFKSAFRNHPAGVAVITADAGYGPVGLTATSVISVSAERSRRRVPELSVGEAAPLVYHNRTWHRLGEHSTIGT
jgi:hypothetical protein